MKTYIWYCVTRNELFTVNKKPVYNNKMHEVFFEFNEHKVYLSKACFFIGEL
jgi:hypothetical protein